MALIIAIGFKVGALPYAGMLLAAAVCLTLTSRRRAEMLRRLALALGVFLVLLGIFVVGLLAAVHQNYLGLILVHSQRATNSLVERFFQHFTTSGMLLFAYTGVGGLFLTLSALAAFLPFGNRSARLFLAACAAGTALATWTNPTLFSRYFMFPASLLLLCGAVTLADLIRASGERPFVRIGALAGVLAFGVIQWLPFAAAAYSAPANLPLAASDRAEYVRADGSGFGISEMLEALRAVRSPAPQQVIGLFANCTGLYYMAQGNPPILCPRLSPSGEDIPALDNLLTNSRRPGVYVIHEPLPYVPGNIPGQVILKFVRPDDGSPLTLYKLLQE